MCTKHVMPNATFITFIDTPLLKGSETVALLARSSTPTPCSMAVLDDKAPRDCIDDVILGEQCHLKEYKRQSSSEHKAIRPASGSMGSDGGTYPRGIWHSFAPPD